MNVQENEDLDGLADRLSVLADRLRVTKEQRDELLWLVKQLARLTAEEMKASWQVPPRYLTYESGGHYIDKTEAGMRSTVQAHPQDLPICYIGNAPRIDIQDIDRLCARLKLESQGERRKEEQRSVPKVKSRKEPKSGA